VLSGHFSEEEKGMGTTEHFKLYLKPAGHKCTPVSDRAFDLSSLLRWGSDLSRGSLSSGGKERLLQLSWDFLKGNA
jgi:hypothetical protein